MTYDNPAVVLCVFVACFFVELIYLRVALASAAAHLRSFRATLCRHAAPICQRSHRNERIWWKGGPIIHWGPGDSSLSSPDFTERSRSEAASACRYIISICFSVPAWGTGTAVCPVQMRPNKTITQVWQREKKIVTVMQCRKTEVLREEGYLIRVREAARHSMAQGEKHHRQTGRGLGEAGRGQPEGREEEAEGKDKQKPFLPAASVRRRASTVSDVSADSSKSTSRSPPDQLESQAAGAKWEDASKGRLARFDDLKKTKKKRGEGEREFFMSPRLDGTRVLKIRRVEELDYLLANVSTAVIRL